MQLWPAIWMLPVNDTYGPWAMSGLSPDRHPSRFYCLASDQTC